MSFNQTEFYEKLEKLGKSPNPETFFFEFLEAIDTAKATITSLKNGNNPMTGSGLNGIARRQSIYFEAITTNNFQDLYQHLDIVKANAAIQKNRIRIIFLTNFQQILAYDVKLDETLAIEYFEDLNSEFPFFLPLVGIEKAQSYTEHPADVRASEKMGRLFDLIHKHNDFRSSPESIHALNLFLSRLLFCFFADDTELFNKDSFSRTLEDFTLTDGSNTKEFFNDFFQVLNLPENSPERQKFPTYLHQFPYVNGGVFAEIITIPNFTARSRRMLIECARLDWSQINPDIFGSMFQAVIDPQQRSQRGQHYTSIPNILKVINPLFIDPLKQELDAIANLSDANKSKNNKKERLEQFLKRLQNIKVFDPACGSGNFLITAYKELRLLEIETFKHIQQLTTQGLFAKIGELGFGFDTGIKLQHFYGIDVDDFAVQIAYLSLYLAEHQMNTLFSKTFGQGVDTLPLQMGGHIVQANSLRTDWHSICPNQNNDEIYIISNPPFNGKAKRNDEQKQDMEIVFRGFSNKNTLDYVACWFWKAGQYIRNTYAKMAMVATNSLAQGEQVSLLFKPLFNLDLTIQFAYPSFVWKNNARDNAAVHVVVIGLTDKNNPLNTAKSLYYYDDSNDIALQSVVENINPYLIEGSDLVVEKRNTTITGQPPILFGNMPYDSGHLSLSSEEKDELIAKEPKAAKWIKKLMGADEFLNARQRFCLWLVGITPEELEAMPMVKARVEKVRQTRLASKDQGAHRLAERPHQFRDLNNPDKYILIPSVSSERRPYIPIDFLNHEVISTNANQIIPNATLFDFGILTSAMHNDWMRLIAGRLENRYRYSGTIVYNTFPFPKVSDTQKIAIEHLAKNILRARAMHPQMTLAEMYNPETMPDNLKSAHAALDKAVDELYRPSGFKDAKERVALLLACYDELIKQEQPIRQTNASRTRQRRT